ncbi:MAG TPA: hypothetical protein IAB06_00890 [Candidatus Avacidaminococcus intestinavium]|uniref:Uncharacterized protein n=1 Tax=Candidatus Avacidaminococcus intestinavium TaxID=2840684 RepID=A0A9D1MP00_9FIRM|nr:hypothetical protein [Candidatus Avacidaminococcus intestinavium]
MKKIICLVMLGMMIFCPLAMAAETQQNSYDWEISMQPKPTSDEIEAARWSFILENNFGVYAYEAESLKADLKKHRVEAMVKTVFTNEEVLKKLNQTYADKLENKDKVAYCEMLLVFNPIEKTYAVKGMDVYSKNKVKLEQRENKVKLVPVPEKTFAEVMLEIATTFYNTQAEGINK